MALVIEDGSGKTNAQTYYSSASVGSYCSQMGYTSWASLATTSQEQAILRGMAYIESFDYKGTKGSSNQSLEWPRSNAKDKNGYSIASNTIPLKMKKAVAEASYRESVESGVLQPVLTIGAGVIKKEKIGPIETEYMHGSYSDTEYVMLDNYLQEFVYNNAISMEIGLG